MCFVTGAAAAGAIAGGASLATATIDVAIVSAALSVAASATQASQAKDAAKFNEKAADAQAKGEISAGAQRAGVVTEQGRQIASSQIAAQGSTGFDVAGGNSMSIIDDTLRRTSRDAAAEFTGGARKAAAYQIEGTNARIAGRSARNRAVGEIGGTVLGTAGTVASSWYNIN